MIRPCLLGFFLSLPLALQAMEFTIKDNITGFDSAATNSLNNQTAGAGGRQILLTQHTFTQQTEVTRFLQLSNSTLATANAFSYSVRELNTPFTELFTGTAIRTDRSLYSNVTIAGNDTNLDEFSIVGLTLDPGTYYFAVHASDGNTYQSAASTGLAAGPLLAENGGLPFLAGSNFHMYTALFGRLSSAAILAEQTNFAFNTIPVNATLISFAERTSFSNINLRLQTLKGDYSAASGYGATGTNAGDKSPTNSARLWTEGNFANLEHDVSSSISGYDGDSTSGQIGVDLAYRPDLVVGVAYGYSKTETDLDDDLGSTDITGNQISVYAQQNLGDSFFASYVYSYESYELDLERDAGSLGTAEASPDAGAQTLQASVVYEFSLNEKYQAAVEGSLRYSRIDIDSYDESGAGAGSLSVAGQDSKNTSASVGGSIRYRTGQLAPYASLSYEYNKLNFDDIDVALVQDPAQSSSQDVSDNSDNYWSLDTGLDYLINADSTFRVGLKTTIGGNDFDFQSLNLAYSLNLQ